MTSTASSQRCVTEDLFQVTFQTTWATMAYAHIQTFLAYSLFVPLDHYAHAHSWVPFFCLLSRDKSIIPSIVIVSVPNRSGHAIAFQRRSSPRNGGVGHVVHKAARNGAAFSGITMAVTLCSFRKYTIEL